MTDKERIRQILGAMEYSRGRIVSSTNVFEILGKAIHLTSLFRMYKALLEEILCNGRNITLFQSNLKFVLETINNTPDEYVNKELKKIKKKEKEKSPSGHANYILGEYYIEGFHRHS